MTFPVALAVVTVLFLLANRFGPLIVGATAAGAGGLSPGVKTALTVVVILALGGAALYIILSRTYDESHQKWAYGVLGSILGFVTGSK